MARKTANRRVKTVDGSTWQAATKAEINMNPNYISYPVSKRMEYAVKAAHDGLMSQAAAAREYGVSRSKVNQGVKKLKEALDAQEARAAAHQAALTAQEEVVLPEGVREVPDFKTFMDRYFGSLICPDCGVHHEVPDFHVEMADLITGTDTRVLINLPPFHSKSTLVTVFGTIYKICRNPNIRVIIVSKTQYLAERFLGQIKKYLADPGIYEDAEANLIDDYGPFYNKDAWSADTIYIAGRRSTEKDPTVRALGFGGQIYGARADEIIFDDVADLENQRNPKRVDEMFLWATQEAGSRVGRNGKLIWVGTRISPGDVYLKLEELPGYTIMRRSCIVDEDTRTTLWPDHYPFETADDMRKSLTNEQWQLVYQNVNTPGVDQAFPPEVMERCRDAERSLGQFSSTWHLVAGLDPAGANSQAGYTALILMGINTVDGRRYLVDLVNAKQLKAFQLRDQLFAWADQYPLNELRVESNGLQAQLVQYNQEIVQYLTKRGIRVVPHVTTGHNKWDPQFGVEAMAPLFYNQQVSMPWGDVVTRQKVRELERQFVEFPQGAISDLVMAFWFAELGCKEIHQRQVSANFHPRFKVPKRIQKQRRVVDFSNGTVRGTIETDFIDPQQQRINAMFAQMQEQREHQHN